MMNRCSVRLSFSGQAEDTRDDIRKQMTIVNIRLGKNHPAEAGGPPFSGGLPK